MRAAEYPSRLRGAALAQERPIPPVWVLSGHASARKAKPLFKNLPKVKRFCSKAGPLVTMTTITLPGQALEAYDVLAPHYDVFTEDYAYDRWVAEIECRAAALGLRGRRALDLACGTGNSTAPLLSRGYSVLACDISSGMIEQARRKHPGHADAFEVADMRDLPELGEFDLVLCLDDAVNYLLSDDELEDTFRGVARVLAPEGIFAFDVNSLLTYRTAFAQDMVKESDGVLLAWRGETTPEFASGEVGTAGVVIFGECDDGRWRRRELRHVQRHHPPEAVRGALARAGLACRVVGQHPGARLVDDADDERHIKLVYFAWHAERGHGRGRSRRRGRGHGHGLAQEFLTNPAPSA
jgi:SAM-dependent methyltransferase